MGELVRAKQVVDEFGISDRAVDERSSGGHVRLVSAAEVVEDDDVVAHIQKVSRDVSADEAGAAGDQDLHRSVRLAARARRSDS